MLFTTVTCLLFAVGVDVTGALTCNNSAWIPYERTGKCYLPVHQSATFYYADTFCRLVGGEIVSIGNVLEMAFVNAIYNGDKYWIGFRKLFGTWVWSDGSPVTYWNWRPGQPDNCCGTDISCVIANYVGTNGQWDDTGCANTWNGFVCKTAGVNTTTTTTTQATVTTVTSTMNCINGYCPDGYICQNGKCVPGTNSCVNGLCPNSYVCYQGQCVFASNYYGPCGTNNYCSMGICNGTACIG